MSQIVPLTERRSRLPVAGRIRLGVKGRAANGKIKPISIDTFRFTCRRREDLDMIATLYGGEVRPWSDPKSEDAWEVITTSSEIKIALPPDPLADSFYEMWGGRGLQRQCDGEVCSTPVSGPQGTEFAEGPCLCRERGIKECKPKLRLNVLLPELPMRGVWRLETGSEAALDEMPGIVRTLEHLQGEGLTMGLLRLERRQSSGGSKRYVVPVLGLSESLEGLIAGRARLAALPSSAGGEQGTSGSVPQLPPASPDDCQGCLSEASGGPLFPHTCEAEIVEDDIAGNAGLDADKGGWEPSPREKARLLRVVRARAMLDGIDPPDTWEAAVRAGLT